MKAWLAADRAAVAAAALVAALLIAQQVAGRALRDALFLSAYSVTSLPGMMFVSAVVSVGGALAFAAAGARRSPMMVVTGALGLSALLFACEWRLAPEHPRLVAAAVYVQLALLGPGIVSGFWSLVNERFDPHTARRVVAEIGAGASVGGVLGGVLAWAGSRVVPVPALLLGLSATSLLALLVLPRLRPPVSSRDARETEPEGGLFARVRWIRDFPYLRQLAALVRPGSVRRGAARLPSQGRRGRRLRERPGSGGLLQPLLRLRGADHVGHPGDHDTAFPGASRPGGNRLVPAGRGRAGLGGGPVHALAGQRGGDARPGWRASRFALPVRLRAVLRAAPRVAEARDEGARGRGGGQGGRAGRCRPRDGPRRVAPLLPALALAARLRGDDRLGASWRAGSTRATSAPWSTACARASSSWSRTTCRTPRRGSR